MTFLKKNLKSLGLVFKAAYFLFQRKYKYLTKMLISLKIQKLLQINMKNTNNTRTEKNGKSYIGNSQKKYKLFNLTREQEIAN